MCTAPKTCPDCGAALDANEVCACRQEAQAPAGTGAMEFVMGDSLERLPATIDFNFEQLKQGLSLALERYQGLVVTEDGIKAAKEDRAKLSKLREAIEAKRKEVKKQCMAPYTDFEAKVKELVGLIDQPIAAIDGQLNAYEERRRAEKYSAAEAVYDETVGELRSLLPFEKLWQASWYNVGVSMKKIRDAIVAAEQRAAHDLDILSTVESEFMEPVKMKYLETLDLSAALAERVRLQEQARSLREFEAQRAKAAANLPEEQRAKAAAHGAEQAQGAEKVYRLAFECQVTRGQAAALAEYLQANNISYRRI